MSNSIIIQFCNYSLLIKSFFWLKVWFDTKTISDKEYDSISKDCTELEKILFSIMKKVRINKESGH